MNDRTNGFRHSYAALAGTEGMMLEALTSIFVTVTRTGGGSGGGGRSTARL